MLLSSKKLFKVNPSWSFLCSWFQYWGLFIKKSALYSQFSIDRALSHYIVTTTFLSCNSNFTSLTTHDETIPLSASLGSSIEIARLILKLKHAFNQMDSYIRREKIIRNLNFIVFTTLDDEISIERKRRKAESGGFILSTSPRQREREEKSALKSLSSWLAG